MSSATAGRRTQAERSSQTRSALLKAVLDAVLEEGWSGLRSAGVARRAGVSLGAQTHHFPSKSGLVLAAVQQIAERYFPAGDDWLPDGPPDERLAAWLERAFAFAGEEELNVLWLETLVAARTQAELREPIRERDDATLRGAPHAAATHIEPDPAARADLEDRLRLTIYVLRGMILEQLLHDGADQARLFERWKDLAFPELRESEARERAPDENEPREGET